MAWKELIITAQSAGAAVTAAAQTTLLPTHAKIPLAGGFFGVLGKRLHIHAGGKVSTAITTPGTPKFEVRLGATTVFDSGLILIDTVAAHTDKPWSLDLYLTLTIVGAAAAFLGYGEFKSEVVRGSGTMPLGALIAMLPWNAAPANGNTFDATVSQVLDLMWTQTVATGSITLQDYEATTNHTE